jgi:predicted anti-sigma-YlaC factor YlaD
VTCQEIANFLYDYLNGDLTESERLVFEEHLGECPNCVAYLQSYEMTVKLSKNAWDERIKHNGENVPEDLIRAILDARKRSA